MYLIFLFPWFTRRSYDYFEIKKFIINFIENYLPNLKASYKISMIYILIYLCLNVFPVSKILVHSYKIKRELLKGLIIFLKTFTIKFIFKRN